MDNIRQLKKRTTEAWGNLSTCESWHRLHAKHWRGQKDDLDLDLDPTLSWGCRPDKDVGRHVTNSDPRNKVTRALTSETRMGHNWSSEKEGHFQPEAGRWLLEVVAHELSYTLGILSQRPGAHPPWRGPSGAGRPSASAWAVSAVWGPHVLVTAPPVHGQGCQPSPCQGTYIFTDLCVCFFLPSQGIYLNYKPAVSQSSCTFTKCSWNSQVFSPQGTRPNKYFLWNTPDSDKTPQLMSCLLPTKTLLTAVKIKAQTLYLPGALDTRWPSKRAKCSFTNNKIQQGSSLLSHPYLATRRRKLPDSDLLPACCLLPPCSVWVSHAKG